MKPNYLTKHFLGTFIFFAVIFGSAGRLDYWQGLVYLAIELVMFVLQYTVFRIDPELMKERAKPAGETKQWDKIILGLSFLATIAMYIVAGLDSGRFHWSPEFPFFLYLLGFVLTVTGQLLFLIAQKQNRFFSSTYSIQSARDHAVCHTGLYRFVRHPAYLGMVIQSLGFPLLFGSLWSIIPVSLLIMLVITRTILEDKALKKELGGYTEYTQTIRYKIIPGIW